MEREGETVRETGEGDRKGKGTERREEREGGGGGGGRRWEMKLDGAD